MTTFAERIKIEMDRKGFTQEKFAEKAGVSQALIHKLVSGKALESRKISQLASALGVNADWLATGRGNKSITPANDPTHDKIMRILMITKDAIDVSGREFSQEKLERIYKTCIDLGLDSDMSVDLIRRYVDEVAQK
jgi:transcriptional regulator with XRE-family HTH domain